MSKRAEQAIRAFAVLYGTEQEKNKAVVSKCISDLQDSEQCECANECEYALGMPVVVYIPPANPHNKQPHAKKGHGKSRKGVYDSRGLAEMTLSLPSGQGID